MLSAAPVGVGRSGPQLPGHRLPRAVFPVIDEREERVEPEPALERRRSELLLTVGGDQSGVHVDDHLPARLPSDRTPATPNPIPSSCTRRGDRPRRSVDVTAASAATRRTEGSEATDPNTSGCAGTTATSAHRVRFGHKAGHETRTGCSPEFTLSASLVCRRRGPNPNTVEEFVGPEESPCPFVAVCIALGLVGGWLVVEGLRALRAKERDGVAWMLLGLDRHRARRNDHARVLTRRCVPTAAGDRACNR
jgi:hypothetical protein